MNDELGYSEILRVSLTCVTSYLNLLLEFKMTQ
jgi:hypothetical protein